MTAMQPPFAARVTRRLGNGFERLGERAERNRCLLAGGDGSRFDAPGFGQQHARIRGFMVFGGAPPGCEQFLPFGARQRGREQDHRAAHALQPAQQVGDQPAGINIVGMHFVEDDDAVGKPPEPHEMVLDVQHGVERLIDRADPEGGKQRTLGLGKPTRRGDVLARFAVHPAQRLIRINQLGAGMRELDVELHVVPVGKGFQETHGALEHGVAGRLRRQPDVKPAQAEAPLQAQKGQKGRLGFAFAHGRFDEHERRFGEVVQHFIDGSLQGARHERFACHAGKQCGSVFVLVCEQGEGFLPAQFPQGAPGAPCASCQYAGPGGRRPS